MIKVDTQRMIEVFLGVVPSPEEIKDAQAAIASAARSEWVRIARQELRGTERDYVEGIGEVEDRGKVHAIVLTGDLPNMVEKGWGARDLRDTLLGPNSKRRKTKDGGYYNIIPFRHGTPGTSGENVGPAMPPSIHAVAKKLKPIRRGHAIKKNQTLHKGLPMSALARRVLSTKKAQHHSTPIHQGMVRLAKKGVTSGYLTFRVISTNGDPAKWQHPGISARRFVDRVSSYTKKHGPALIRYHAGGGRGA